MYSILLEEWRDANKTIQSERFYAALCKYRNERRKAFRFGQPGGVDEVDGDDENTSSSTQTEKANNDEEEDDDINIVFSEKVPSEEFSNQLQDVHEKSNATDTCVKSEYNRCVCC